MLFVIKKTKSNFVAAIGLWLSNLTISPSQHQNKTHDYSQLLQGKDYVLEVMHEGLEAQMTGVGKGIKPLDYILVQHGSEIYKYQIEEIDYYSDPSDMWIALLKLVK